MAITGEQLRQHFPDLTAELDEDGCTTLAAELGSCELSSGDTLLWRGESADTMFLVESGVLSAFIEDAGLMMVLGQAGPGSTVGEVGLIEPGPVSATVSAAQDARLHVLDRATYEKLRREHPRVARSLVRALNRELVDRLRYSSAGIVWQVEDEEALKAEAKRDRDGWLGRLRALFVGRRGSE